ncbi:unnamed protein product [Prorocentrum cordatum]|uniref:Uncharacterized protein n=1 Tax=Prorocentrum cordatum TaxID=2364126 RepID=A0ABN9T5R1_9DINO|nr:unnamed protein product [Polarella glacialis]
MDPVVSSDSSPVVAIDLLSVLWYCGRIFRKQHTAAEYATGANKIDDFWSYSRHGNDTAHTLMLLLHYNGLPSAVMGILAAVVGACLMPLDWVPNHNFAGILVMLLATCVAFVLVLSSVIPRRVFLDFVHSSRRRGSQERRHPEPRPHPEVFGSHDLALGRDILDSALVRIRVRSLLEIATQWRCLQEDGDVAGAHRRADGGNVIAISVMLLCKNTSASFSEQRLADVSLKGVGISVAANTVSLTLSVLCLACSGLRYVNLLKEQHIQLQRFSLRGSNCFCFTVAHVNPKTSERMGCDKVLIEASVVACFGCIETFES